jgi:GNAT superfamily N-acetyltransferase
MVPSIIRALMPDYRIRAATLEDLDALVHHRAAMFTDMGVEVDVAALSHAYHAWLRKMLPPGDYRAWVSETASGAVVAGGGILVLPWPPGPQAVSGERLAFVYNIYTEPAHRKRGLARSLMETIQAWCAKEGIPALALNAAADARHLYESMGYFDAPSPMMYKKL